MYGSIVECCETVEELRNGETVSKTKKPITKKTTIRLTTKLLQIKETKFW